MRSPETATGASKSSTSKSNTSKAGAAKIQDNKAEKKSSPFLIATAITLGIGAGAVLSTLGTTGFDQLMNVLDGPRQMAQTQQHHGDAIAALQKTLASMSSDVEFLELRIENVAKRNDTTIAQRLTEFNADIAALKRDLAAVNASQSIQPAAGNPSQVPVQGSAAGAATKEDLAGLRSSLHDFAMAQAGEITALTQRLDKLEALIAARAEVTSSIPKVAVQKPSLRKKARFARANRKIKTVPATVSAVELGEPAMLFPPAPPRQN